MKLMAAPAGTRRFCVVRHGVGLAERDGGDTVRIHVAARLVQRPAVRTDAHVVDQISQAAVDGRFISLAVLVRLSAAQKRQQRQGGGGVAAPPSRPGFRHAPRQDSQLA